MNKKILLIDSNTTCTSVLKTYLESEAFDVSICNDSTEGATKALNEQYNLIILDIVMPSLNGFELLKSLQKEEGCPVIIFTERDEYFDRIYALEMGADDYLLKSINKRELLARIKIFMRRNIDLGHQVLSGNININNVNLRLSSREAYYGQNLLKLTGAEFEVLYFLMSNIGKINSKEKIGQRVFGRIVSYYDRSIEMHICNIRKKYLCMDKKYKLKRYVV